MSFKINLLPEAKQIQRKIQKLNMLSTTVSLALVIFFAVVVVIFLVLNVAQKVRINNFKTSIETTENEIDRDYKDLEETVISLENGIKNIQNIINGENKWSLFFDELEKSTPSEIQFTSLDINAGKVKAELVGKDVDSLARFVNTFNSYKVKKTNLNLYENVSVKGYKKDGKVVKFSAEFDINTGALWQSN